MERSIIFNELELNVPVLGVQPSYRHVHRLDLSAGRFVSRFDSAKAYCVVGDRLYHRLRRSESDSLVGQKINIGQQLCQVIGVLQPSQSISDEHSIDDALLLPFYTLAQFFVDPEITEVTLRANPKLPVAGIEDYIRSALSRYLGDISNYEISNQGVFLEIMARHLNVSLFMLGLFAAFFLIIAVWIFLRMMTLSLVDQESHFHLIRTFGITVDKVKLSLLFKALIVGITGGVAGVIVGGTASYIYAIVNNWVPFFSTFAAVVSISIGLFVAVFMGWVPAIILLKATSK